MKYISYKITMIISTIIFVTLQILIKKSNLTLSSLWLSLMTMYSYIAIDIKRDIYLFEKIQIRNNLLFLNTVLFLICSLSIIIFSFNIYLLSWNLILIVLEHILFYTWELIIKNWEDKIVVVEEIREIILKSGFNNNTKKYQIFFTIDNQVYTKIIEDCHFINIDGIINVKKYKEDIYYNYSENTTNKM